MGSFPETRNQKSMEYRKFEVNQPTWNSVIVTRHLPESLKDLEILSKNLWWCWNESAKNLFASIDPEAWEASGQNPIAMLDKVTVSVKYDTFYASSLSLLGNHFTNFLGLLNLCHLFQTQ